MSAESPVYYDYRAMGNVTIEDKPRLYRREKVAPPPMSGAESRRDLAKLSLTRRRRRRKEANGLPLGTFALNDRSGWT